MPREKQRELKKCLEVVADTESEDSIKFTSIMNFINLIDENIEK